MSGVYLRSATEKTEEHITFDPTARCARKGSLNVDERCVCGSSPNTKPYSEDSSEMRHAFDARGEGLRITPAAIQVMNLVGVPQRPNRAQC